MPRLLFNGRNALESGPVDLHSLALKFPPQVTPEFVLRNGWCPPPEKQPDLPFQVCSIPRSLYPVTAILVLK